MQETDTHVCTVHAPCYLSVTFLTALMFNKFSYALLCIINHYLRPTHQPWLNTSISV